MSMATSGGPPQGDSRHFDLASMNSRRGLGVGAQRALYIASAGLLLLLAALFIGSILSPYLPWVGRGSYGPPSASVAFGLAVLFVSFAAILLLVNSWTGERATSLTLSSEGAEFCYPSGRRVRFDWRSSRPLTIRQYRLPGGSRGSPRTMTYSGGTVRTFLTPEALDALCHHAEAQGAQVRRWERTFPAHQRLLRIGGTTA